MLCVQVMFFSLKKMYVNELIASTDRQEAALF